MTFSGWDAEPQMGGGSEVGETGVRRYLRILREHRFLVVAAIVITALAALAYSISAEDTYKAEALLQVTPVSRDDGVLSGVPVVRESSDPSRELETLSRFITTGPVYLAALENLEESGSAPANFAERVTALPVANSLLISVVAEAPDPADAQRIANAYAEGALSVRAASFNRQVASVITRLEASLEEIPSTATDARAAIAQRIAGLRALRGGPDPSISLLAEAPLPESPTSPSPLLVVIAGALVGAFWGFGAAVLSDTLLSRLRRDRQITESFSLPVLARVPSPRGRSSSPRPLTPEQLDPVALEGYRTLRQNLELLRQDDASARVVVFTSAGPSEGKTTSAINTAATLAQSGYRVMLIDADLRHPSIASVLGVASPASTASVLAGVAALDDAVVPLDRYSGTLELLLASPGERPRIEAMTRHAVDLMLSAARERADFVVVDTAPLGTVADALPVVSEADDVFVVARRGHTRMAGLRRLVQILRFHKVSVRGFVLIGAERERVTGASRYYQEMDFPGTDSGATRAPARRRAVD